MLRKFLILGSIASVAGFPFLLPTSSPPPRSDAEVETGRLVRLCEAGVKPARDCGLLARARPISGAIRGADVSKWADPRSAEQATADILASTTDAPEPEPTATGSVAETGPGDEATVSPSEETGVSRATSGPHQPRLESGITTSEPAGANSRDSTAAVVPPPPRTAISRASSRPAEPAGPAAKTNSPAEQTPKEAASRVLAQAYLDSWSSSGGQGASEVRNFYANRVQYFGQAVDQRALVDIKRRFVERSPVRHYRHRAGSLNVRCDASGPYCTVRSLVDYVAANPSRGARARGSLQLELRLDVSGPRPVVVSETARKIASGGPAPVSAPVTSSTRPVLRAEEPRRSSQPRNAVGEVWMEGERDWIE